MAGGIAQHSQVFQLMPLYFQLTIDSATGHPNSEPCSEWQELRSVQVPDAVLDIDVSENLENRVWTVVIHHHDRPNKRSAWMVFGYYPIKNRA